MSELIIIAAYNCDKKELLGIFANQSVCAKYLQAGKNKIAANMIRDSLRRKSKMHNHRFDFRITIREAKEDQIELLAGKRIHIMEGYPMPTACQASSFESTRYSLTVNHTKNKQP